MSRPERRLQPDRSALDRFGHELRKWRKTRGLSQDRLGALVHVSGDLLYRIEVGDRRPGRDLATSCDETLGADGALIRAWEAYASEAEKLRSERDDTDNNAVHTDKPHDLVAMSQPGSEMITVSMMSLTGESVPVIVDRRAFVGGAMSLPLVGWVGRGLPDITAPPPDGDLDDIVHAMASLRLVLAKQDNVLGSGVAAPTVIHQLSILERLSQNAKGRARESVRRIQAAYAEFAGWLADELGDRRSGQYWTDRALEWAHEIDDELVIGYILARKAQRAIEAGDPASAISLAHAAQRRGLITERVRAAALQYGAIGHASVGETANFRVAIDRARELVEAASPATVDEWAVWCTPGYVSMYEASGWMKLGEHSHAVAAYQRWLSNWPGEFRRDEGIYYGRLACAYAGAGSPEEAASAGHKALEIAAGTGSIRILTELRALKAYLAEWHDLPPVGQFSGELQRVLALTERKPLREISP